MKIKILVVDDEILQLNLICKVIRQIRPAYEIISTHQPAQALEILKNNQINALLTDVKMPEMNGLELIKAARDMKLHPFEVIVLSGFDDFEYAKQAISFDVLEYILKPINRTTLQRAIDKLENALSRDYSQVEINQNYHQIINEQCASTLFKKANRFILSQQEEYIIGMYQAQVERVCLVLIEGGSAGQRSKLQETLKPPACLLEISQAGILAFLPENFNLLSLHKHDKRRIIFTKPRSIAKLPDAWKRCQALADTARRMRLQSISEDDIDKELLEYFQTIIRSRSLADILNISAKLRIAVQKGSLTLTDLYEMVVDMLPELSLGSELQSSGRYIKEIMAKTKDEIYNCDTPESLCRFITQYITLDKSNDSSSNFTVCVQAYIDAHYHQHCALQDIAEAFHYSPSHFSRLFNASFGTTYTRYLSNYRMKIAGKLSTPI